MYWWVVKGGGMVLVLPISAYFVVTLNWYIVYFYCFIIRVLYLRYLIVLEVDYCYNNFVNFLSFFPFCCVIYISSASHSVPLGFFFWLSPIWFLSELVTLQLFLIWFCSLLMIVLSIFVLFPFYCVPFFFSFQNLRLGFFKGLITV